MYAIYAGSYGLGSWVRGADDHHKTFASVEAAQVHLDIIRACWARMGWRLSIRPYHFPCA